MTNTNTLKKIVKSLFNLKASTISEIEKSVNDTYKVTSHNEKFALRRSKITPYYSHKQAISEYHLLNAINNTSELQVITPHSPPKEYAGKIYLLTKWIEGTKFRKNNNQLTNASKYLAQLHKTLRELKLNFEEGPGDNYIDDLLSGKNSEHIAFERYTPYVQKTKEIEDLYFLEKLTKDLGKNNRDYKTKLGPKQIIHGDPRAENFIFNGPNVSSIIDFQGARNSYPISDVAWAVSTSFCKKENSIDTNKIKTFIEGYLSVSPLKGISLLPEIIKIRALRSLETICYFEFIEREIRPGLLEKKEKGIAFLKWFENHQEIIKNLTK